MEYTLAQGWAIIIAYAIAVYSVTFLFTKRSRTKDEFLVAKRELSWKLAAPSITASWIWAPALFVAAQQAYIRGWVGLFYFSLMNIATLAIFGVFMHWLRDKQPFGFTLSGYIRDRFGQRTQNLYLLELIVLAAASFAVQLLAGAGVVTLIAGIPFWQVTVAMAVIALGYSAFSGIRASVITDWMQFALIGVGVLVFVPWVIYQAGGLSVVGDGIRGRSGTFDSLFAGDGLEVLWLFGIATWVGHFSGTFADQSFYQRGFSIKQPDVFKAFMWAAAIFALVPILFGQLGFVAAGLGMEIENTSFVNVGVVGSLLPVWTLVPFLFILFSGLVSTLDSNLASISSLVGHDGFNRFGKTTFNGGDSVLDHPSEDTEQASILRWSRVAMVVLAVGAVAIANIPGIRIVYLFLFFGALRSAVVIPTIYAIWRRDRYVSERGMFYGIAVALFAFLPLFAWGNFQGIVWASLTGTFAILISSAVILIGWTWYETNTERGAQLRVEWEERHYPIQSPKELDRR